MRLGELPTPALVVDLAAFEHNVATMAAAWPGERLRPHVKAFKSTALARRLVAAGHAGFCCATARELVGMADAGLGHDLLLANELVDPRRLAHLATLDARVTVAVDSDETVDAAAVAGIGEVLIDVNVGLPRCGCDPADAARLAERARAAGLTVRGVMGYEGHLVGLTDRTARVDGTAASMAVLTAAHAEVGGDVVSGGGTGTWDCNEWVTELQAGSYTLMDTAYAGLDLPFRQAFGVLGTVVSVNAGGGWAVADVGLKALGMDHGNPGLAGRGTTVWFCSDEHLTFGADPRPPVGDRVLVWPAHIDPTIAMHEAMHVVAGPLTDDDGRPDLDAEVLDVWPVDLRGW